MPILSSEVGRWTVWYCKINVMVHSCTECLCTKFDQMNWSLGVVKLKSQCNCEHFARRWLELCFFIVWFVLSMDCSCLLRQTFQSNIWTGVAARRTGYTHQHFISNHQSVWQKICWAFAIWVKGVSYDEVGGGAKWSICCTYSVLDNSNVNSLRPVYNTSQGQFYLNGTVIQIGHIAVRMISFQSRGDYNLPNIPSPEEVATSVIWLISWFVFLTHFHWAVSISDIKLPWLSIPFQSFVCWEKCWCQKQMLKKDVLSTLSLLVTCKNHCDCW